MAESIKKFIIKDAHGGTKESGSFSVVGEVHVNIVPGYGEPYAESVYVNGILTITIHNIEGNGITEITTDSQEGDEAVNTVTIKTNANPEGVTLEVRNGSRGNGIASSTEVLSPEDGGTNTHTITDTDGNEHVFHTKNGHTGRKGVQGDSAVYDPSSPDAPDFVMANTTGQSTTKAMTQKAVTEALMNSPKSFVLNGLGGDNNSQITFRLKPGHMYEFALSKTTWSNSATVATIFSIGKYVGEEWSPLYTVTKGNAAQPKYLVAAEPDATGYTVAVRASVDEQIELTIRDINTIYSNVDTHFVGDSCTKTFNNTNGFRYYVRLDKEFQPPYILRLKGEMPDGIQWSMQGFATLADMQSISTNPVESTLYVDKATEHKFEGTPYCRVIFKSESGSLTSAQMATISKNIVLDVMSFGSGLNAVPIMDSDNNIIFPLTNSSSVYHDGNTLKNYLDMAVFYKEFPLSSMEKSSPIAARMRYTAKVPQIPFYASIEGSVPSGFICSLQTNYTLSDAQSPNVAEVQSSGWGGRSAYFDAENAYYVTIGWKKLDNSAFTEEEIALLEASNVKLVVKNFSSGNDDRTDIISLNDEKNTLTYLRNAKRSQYKGSSYSPTTTPCTLLHFSDIHADEPNMKRIVQFYNHYKAYIDDALCTGDIIQNLFGDSFAFWENAEAGLILNCTGNHEYYNGESSAPYYKQITQKQVYDKFFAPYIEYWSVTQPTDAEENGLNYYFKDYTTSKVRLIVLDNMRVDETQIAWFEEVLADAITNNYHVVAAMHIGNPVGWVKYDNPFNSLKENNPSPLNAWVFADSELLYDKVDEFIGNNGVFVGWLMGHIHSDTIGTPQGHPNQLEIHVATGSCGSAWGIIPKGDNCDRTPGSKSQDCFNIYSIDTYYKMIRIHRIGCDVDRDFRHIGNLCYDYENHRVIYVD